MTVIVLTATLHVVHVVDLTSAGVPPLLAPFLCAVYHCPPTASRFTLASLAILSHALGNPSLLELGALAFQELGAVY